MAPSLITCSNAKFSGNSGADGGQTKNDTSEQPTEIAGGFGLTCLAESPLDAPSDYNVFCGFTALDGSKLAPSDEFDFEVVLKNVPSGIIIRKEPRGEKYTFEFDIQKSVASTLVLETKAVNIKSNNSEIKALSFEFQKITQIPSIVAQPTISPIQGTYSTAQSVTIETITQGAHVKYTIDGTDPSCDTPGSGTVFSSSFSVISTTTIKAIGCKSGDDPSAITTAKLTIASPDTCGQVNSGCYDLQGIQENAVRTLYGAFEIQYVKADPNCVSGCFMVWKEKTGDRILNASGIWNSSNLGWQMKLNRSGRSTGSQLSYRDDASKLAGRACPPEVATFSGGNAPKPTERICLYYDDGLSGDISLNQHNSQILGQDYLWAWNADASGEGLFPDWYEGNIKICADKGMRLPILYETNAPKPGGNSGLPDDPYGVDLATFGGDRSLGVPSVGNQWTWTASAFNPQTTADKKLDYWVWKTSDTSNKTASMSFPVRCVLPATTSSN